VTQTTSACYALESKVCCHDTIIIADEGASSGKLLYLKAAAEYSKHLADEGDISTQWACAQPFADGLGAELDLETAAKFFKQIADQ
jgi:TPR repeat protein